MSTNTAVMHDGLSRLCGWRACNATRCTCYC